MKKVFLDTNILIDFFNNRSGAFEAGQILRAANAGEINVFASLLTFGVQFTLQCICKDTKKKSIIKEYSLFFL